MLCVVSNESRDLIAPLLQITRNLGEVILAETVAESSKFLSYRDDIDVVLTASSLQDGNWVGVLGGIVQAGSRAKLIVVAQGAAGALRMATRPHGVFGVVGKPLNAEALRNLVRLAADSSRTAPLMVSINATTNTEN